MLKKLLLSWIAVLFLLSTSFGQTNVTPGDGTLFAALEVAKDGDVLQLVPDGLYTESNNFEFGTLVNRDITIEVEGDGSVKAKLQMLTPPTEEDTPIFFEVGDASSLTLRGLEFDGSQSAVPTADYLVNMYMGEIPATTNVKISNKHGNR